MEAKDLREDEDSLQLDYQLSSTLKRYRTQKAVSFGIPLVASPKNLTPRFEDVMRNILSNINYFDKADIVPEPKKLTRTKTPNNQRQETEKNPPKKETHDKSPKSTKHLKNPKKKTAKQDQVKSSKLKFNK